MQKTFQYFRISTFQHSHYVSTVQKFITSSVEKITTSGIPIIINSGLDSDPLGLTLKYKLLPPKSIPTRANGRSAVLSHQAAQGVTSLYCSMYARKKLPPST